MYKLNANAAFNEAFVGEPTSPADVTITLNKGWSWIGYPCQATNPLDAAFSGAEPQNGDMVKSLSGLSVYNGSEWVGTLLAMVPGEGYLYFSQAAAKTFNYPVPSVSVCSQRAI